MRKQFLLLLVILLSIGLLACGGTTTPEKVEEGKEIVQSEVDQEPEPPKTEIFQIGDTVKMAEFEFTLNSVRWDVGTEYFKPEDNEKWLVLDCSIINNSNESTGISSMMMFELIDDQFYKQELNIMADTKGSLDGELGPGRTMRGEIAYAVSTESQSFEFVFSPDIFSMGQAIFSVGVDEIN